MAIVIPGIPEPVISALIPSRVSSLSNDEDTTWSRVERGTAHTPRMGRSVMYFLSNMFGLDESAYSS